MTKRGWGKHAACPPLSPTCGESWNLLHNTLQISEAMTGHCPDAGMSSGGNVQVPGAQMKEI